MKKNKICSFVMLVSVLISLAFVGCGRSYLMIEEDGLGAEQSEFMSAEAGQTERESDIFVQIAGAVEKPGVYVLPEGARVYELIEKAGGLSVDADDTDLNQVAILSDGLKIYVYHEGERTAEINQDILTGMSGDGLININTADETQLCTLPGIGGTRATAIVTYRTQNGRFKSIEDIMLVPGIKDSVFAKVKDLIRV